MIAWPIERRLAMHLVVLACRRAAERAGIRMAMSRAMIPMTTRSSTSVNALFEWSLDMAASSFEQVRGYYITCLRCVEEDFCNFSRAQWDLPRKTLFPQLYNHYT